MAKENKSPYYVNMDISVEKLSNVPKEMMAAEVFKNVLIGSILSVGKKNGGSSMEDHQKLFNIREKLEQAIEVKETNKVELALDEYKFIMRHWNEYRPDPAMNELVIRVKNNLKEAQSSRDKESEAGKQ